MIKKYCLLSLVLTFIFISCTSTPKETPRPTWVDNPKEVYDAELYISRVGEGYTKEEALSDGELELAKYFGQNVTSSVTGIDNWSSTQGKNPTNEKYLSKEYTITFDTTLFAVEKTKPWYDVYSENYYVCVYLNREDAFNIYKPTLIQAKDEFYKFYNESIEEEDFFKKIQLLETTKDVGQMYLRHLNFAQLLVPSVFDTYRKDFTDIANVDVMLEKLRNDVAVNVEVTNDYGNMVNDLVSKYFTDNGFKVSDKDYHYKVLVNIEDNKVIDEYSGIIVIKPIITVSLQDKYGTTSHFTYTRNLDQIKAFNESTINQKAMNAIEQELKLSFEEELKQFLNK